MRKSVRITGGTWKGVAAPENSSAGSRKARPASVAQLHNHICPKEVKAWGPLGWSSRVCGSGGPRAAPTSRQWPSRLPGWGWRTGFRDVSAEGTEHRARWVRLRYVRQPPGQWLCRDITGREVRRPFHEVEWVPGRLRLRFWSPGRGPLESPEEAGGVQSWEVSASEWTRSRTVRTPLEV